MFSYTIIICFLLLVVSLIIAFFLFRNNKKKETFVEVSNTRTWTPDSRGDITIFTWLNPKSRFIYQADGNFVLYDDGNVKWNSDQYFYNVNVQFDANNGKLNLTDSDNNIVWQVPKTDATTPKIKGPFRLVQSLKNNEPNVYIVDINNYIVWMAVPYNQIYNAQDKTKVLYSSPLESMYVADKNAIGSIYYYSLPYLYSMVDTQSSPTLVVSGNKDSQLKHIPRESATIADAIYLHLNSNGTISLVNYKEEFALDNSDLTFKHYATFVNSQRFRFVGIRGWVFS